MRWEVIVRLIILAELLTITVVTCLIVSRIIKIMFSNLTLFTCWVAAQTEWPGVVVVVVSYDSWIYNYIQSVPIITKVVSSNPAHCELYSIQHFVIKFANDLPQVDGFLWVLRLLPLIKLTTTIKFKYCWKWRLTQIT